jgi:RNA-directed DNA polymerase
MAEMVETGQAAAMSQKPQEALRAQHSVLAPVRGVELPPPTGGTRPLGLATVEARVVQTARQRVLEPRFEAAAHDCADGSRPKRNARQASLALQDDLDPRAWGAVEMDGKASFTSTPPRQLRTLIRRRIADGSLLQPIQPTLQGGGKAQGPGVPTPGGGPKAPPSRRRPAIWS